MTPFELSVPTRIYFGESQYKLALRKEKNILQGKIFLVTTGRSLNRLGYVQELNRVLSEFAGTEGVIIFDEISANPKLEEVKKGIEIGKNFQATVVVGFGGGSAIDAAKAIAVGIGSNVPVERFLFDGTVPTSTTLPVVAIPTTAGTGSEVSHGAIITSSEKKVKTGIRGKYICPVVAIVDSQFTWQMPYGVTMQTGFDVFAHAIESYVSKKATRFSELLSLEAIQLVANALLVLKKDLQNKKARDEMSYASLLMGINLAQIGTALPHRMQYPIGAQTDTSHALGLLALYPAWLERVYPFCEDKLKKVAEIIGKKSYSDKSDVLDCLYNFIQNLEIRKNLFALGIKESQIDQLSTEVSGSIENDPAGKEFGIIKNIYEASIK